MGELSKKTNFFEKSVDKEEGLCYYKQALERAGKKRLDESAKPKHFVN